MYGTISIVLLLLGIAAIAYGFIARKKHALISDTPTTKTANIKKEGFFEVKGRVICQNPVSVPNWGIDCVWYNFEAEEKIQYEDDEGRRQTKWRTVDSQSNQCSFQVKDQSGEIWVNPSGAELDGKKKEYNESNVPGFMSSLLSSSQSVGSRVTANYLEVGSFVYVLGKVANNNGNLSFVSGGEAFIISNKSEEEVLSSKANTFTFALAGGFIALIASFATMLIWMR